MGAGDPVLTHERPGAVDTPGRRRSGLLGLLRLLVAAHATHSPGKIDER
jgi:hypothetical protein